MKLTFINLVEIVIIVFALTIGLFYAILPSIVVDLDPLIKSYPEAEQLSRSSLIIGWFGQGILFIIMFGFTLLLTFQYHFKDLLGLLLKAFIMSIGPVCVISFFYMFFMHPDFFATLDWIQTIEIFFQYPSEVSIDLGNPQLIWMITSGSELLIFLLLFYRAINTKLGEYS